MKKQILLTIGLVALLVSGAQASQEKLAKAIGEARAEATKTSEQLKSTLASLNTMTKQKEGDLRPAYNIYCSEVTKTEAAAATTRQRAKWMGGEGRSYFADWQTTVNGIANESLRKKAQKRLDSVKASYDKVEASMAKAGEKFAPFLSDLGDIQKALSTDVTAGAMKSLRGTVRSANWDHQFVNDAVNAALKQMDKMEKALSSSAS